MRKKPAKKMTIEQKTDALAAHVCYNESMAMIRHREIMKWFGYTLGFVLCCYFGILLLLRRPAGVAS